MTSTNKSKTLDNRSMSIEVKEMLKRFDSTLNTMESSQLSTFTLMTSPYFQLIDNRSKGGKRLEHAEAIIEDLLEEHHHPVQTLDCGEVVLHWSNETGPLTLELKVRKFNLSTSIYTCFSL